MNQGTSPSNKQNKVSVIRDYGSEFVATTNEIRQQSVGSERNCVGVADQRKLVQNQRNVRDVPSLSPREGVLKALRLFKLVFEELARDKAARRGQSTATNRIDYDTRAILVRDGKQVNTEKRIGPVPGVQVGDEFDYKTELNLIGLHFDIQGGIDYIYRGVTPLATSIVSTEGAVFKDIFIGDELIYSGVGGNKTEDQRLVKENLALANSMRHKSEVRVIRGRKRLDQRERGTHYVYVGLYLVQDYWQEKGPKGNVLFKFKLRRISGQPAIDLRD